MALNAAISNATLQLAVFIVMAISCVVTLIWAYRVRNKPFLIEESIYLVIACVGMATHTGALGMGYA